MSVIKRPFILQILKKKYVRYGFLILCTFLCFLVHFVMLNLNKEEKAEDLGIQFVNALYDYDTVQELNKNVGNLVNSCTEQVFNQLTIDQEERLLSTYLKFKDSPTHVKVLKEYDGLIMYSILNDYVSEDRVFIFEYEITDGIISQVSEYECINFIK